MKDIEGYEGLYAITRDGKVWSYRANKFLKPAKEYKGYLRVDLHKDGKQKQHKVHRLVAFAFIPNPDNLPQVNHKDENKENNCVENLEWISGKDNCNYGTRNKRLGKAVYCVEQKTVYESVSAASRATNAAIASISRCCKGRQLTAGGYHWEFINEGEAA